VKIVREEILINCGAFADATEWRAVRTKLHKAIKDVEWPPGSGKFTIYAQSGKKRGQGNGVKPIKMGLMLDLKKQGWSIEEPVKGEKKGKRNPGNYDAVFETNHGLVAVEWETGNVSSSHRSLNKMTMGLMRGTLAAGILIVPSREFYRYLTDRVGNIQELEPYFDLWKSIPCKQGILEIAVIEHDAASLKVPRIKKGTDGRALA